MPFKWHSRQCVLTCRKFSAIKKFNIPDHYKSSFIGKIKELRRLKDLRKQDFSPAVLDFGPVKFYIARHFGFCYGVENAIEISYRALEENPGKNVFLLSQMIHNQQVNEDLIGRGIRFIMDTDSKQFIQWNEITSEDVVIIPAFGTTLEIEKRLLDIGVDVQTYNTTCPFVEKVWNRSQKLGKDQFTVIIHGKVKHEETRATFSHSAAGSPSIVLEDMKEAEMLGEFITGARSTTEFFETFRGRYSEGFEPAKDLLRVGVVNQTTMLAAETQAIADYFKQVMISRYGASNISQHFADTRDTLCYATNDNQDSTYRLLETDAHLAIVVGGYNSSNTSHLVELCEQKFPTYFINSEKEILSGTTIRHFDLHHKKIVESTSFLPDQSPVKIILTSGASCPDSLVDRVLFRILEYFESAVEPEQVLTKFSEQYA
ncbi:MAG: 4-hydroxy-3-methylbut-2-enyl diphosphate reductase [Cyclobacteriaceae bacterium]